MPQAPAAKKPIIQAPSSSSDGLVEKRYSGTDSRPTTMPSVAEPRRPPHFSDIAPRAMAPSRPPAFSSSRNESGCNFSVVSKVGYQNVVDW